MDIPYKRGWSVWDYGILKGTYAGRLRNSKEGVNAVREIFGSIH
jgi:hypothetical protein